MNLQLRNRQLFQVAISHNPICAENGFTLNEKRLNLMYSLLIFFTKFLFNFSA